MPTFHRRNGSVKYLPPQRFLEGLRPAVAIPATLFAGLLVVAIAFALHKAPREQKWVNLRPEKEWRPALTEQGTAPPADERFLFTGALERARTPRATFRGQSDAPGLAHTAGRVALAGEGKMIIEHALGTGPERRFVRTELASFEGARFGAGMNVQRGDQLVSASTATAQLDPTLASLPAAITVAPAIREVTEEQSVHFD